MRKFLIAIVVLIVVGLAYVFWPKHKEPPPVADQSTLRQTPLGPVVGFTGKHGANVWLGIPYAAPPVGELRWKAPRPAQPWTTPRDALAIGDMCVQYPSLLSGAGRNSKSTAPVGSEDCLYLNIFAPAFAPGDVPTGEKARPVMFWIHGGGNSIGHGGSYNGSRLATEHGVVVVTINYRLGPFGWFAHPALRSETASAEDNSGNYGLLDSMAALRWVRDNIAAFGGNPNNVTIFGESAGGGDVLALLASPSAKGLFQRAIVESGGMFIASRSVAENYHDDPTKPGHEFSSREVVNRLLVKEGKAQDAVAAKSVQDSMSNDELRTLLANANASDFMALYTGGGFGMIDAPELFSDGVVLPNDVDATTLFSDPTKYNSVPIILGTNRDEPALFMVRDPRWVENRLWIFPRLKDEASYLRRVRYGADSWRIGGVDSIATVLSKSQPGQVFAYRFDWDEEPSLMGYDLSTALGAAHGLEIAFVFGTFEGALGDYLYPKTPARDALSKSMMSYWAEFAYSGNPGKGRDGNEASWLPWGTDGNTTIILDTAPPGIRMSSDLITVDSLKQRLIADTTITDQREHCELYAQTFRWDWFDNEQYLHLGKEGCAAYDPASFRRF